MSAHITRAQNLEDFAKQVEREIIKGKDVGSMQRLICRLLTGPDLKVAAALAMKWVEWRHGKAKETHEHTGKDGAPIAHTIRFADGDER